MDYAKNPYIQPESTPEYPVWSVVSDPRMCDRIRTTGDLLRPNTAGNSRRLDTSVASWSSNNTDRDSGARITMQLV